MAPETRTSQSMKRFHEFFTFSLIAIITLVLPVQSSFAASAKAGGACSKAGITAITSGKVFICSKIGTKLIWKVKVAGVKVSPSPAPEKLAALDHISVPEVVSRVSAYWAKWVLKKSSSDPQVIMESEAGYSHDWEAITGPAVKYLMQILNGNGLKLVPTPYFAFGDSESFRAQAYKNSQCNAPYMPEVTLAIYCGKADIGSGSLRIGHGNSPMQLTNGYKLNVQEKKLLTWFVEMEMGIFYELQAQYVDVPYNGQKDQIPTWLRTGTSQLVATMAANDLLNPSEFYTNFINDPQILPPRMTSLCGKTLQDYEGLDKNFPDDCTFGQNFYAVELLAANHGGYDALFKFDVLYGQDANWTKDFQEAFGISREDFYKEWYTFIGIPQNKWPALKPAAPAQHY